MVVVGAAAMTSGVLLYAVDPHEPGHYPTCPFLAITGWYCPGCGTLRAVHDLTHGQVGEAFGHNPLTVLVLPLLVLAFASWTARALGRSAPTPTQLPPWSVWSGLVVVVAFWILRNVDAAAWLAP